MQFTIIGFMGYTYAVSLAISIHPEYPINSLMLGGLGVLFVLIGNYLSKIKHNFFIGIKTPRTLADEDIGYSYWLFAQKKHQLPH